MMTNLFSSFDPAVSNWNTWMNWTSMMVFLIILPPVFWVIPSKFTSSYKTFIKQINTEMKTLMSKEDYLNSIMYTSLFLFILMNNFMGLFPYIFTGTSHMILNTSIALTFWTSMMIFSMAKKINLLLAHLVPTGTPWALMSFMVIIETASNMIRPVALSVRLSANMIAGHLLLTLISETAESSPYLMKSMILSSQMTLVVLEMAVSVIQAYVFTILTILYVSE